MKKNHLFTFAVMALVSLFVFSMAPVQAQSKSQRKKALENQFKEKKKEYIKGGWSISGSAKTLEVALIDYFDKLAANDNNYPITGEVSACNSINVCKSAAFNNAVTEYANNAGSYVRGRVTSDMQLDQVTGKGFDKFYAAYERLVAAEVKGVLQPSFSIVREKKDGTKEFKTFYVIDEEAASNSRIRALEAAAKETEMAQEYARKISDFVREGFSEIK